MKHGLDAVDIAMSKIGLYSQEAYCLMAYTLFEVGDGNFLDRIHLHFLITMIIPCLQKCIFI